MYQLKPGIKRNPEKRWELPDKIFFGYGACHILAGVYLKIVSPPGFYALWVKPGENYSGNHIFVTNGDTAFDYHGYSKYERLLQHHKKGWLQKHDGWNCRVIKVNFDLLNTKSLNARKMLGPDQYLHDPVPRARLFIQKFNHAAEF